MSDSAVQALVIVIMFAVGIAVPVALDVQIVPWIGFLVLTALIIGVFWWLFFSNKGLLKEAFAALLLIALAIEMIPLWLVMRSHVEKVAEENVAQYKQPKLIKGIATAASTIIKAVTDKDVGETKPSIKYDYFMTSWWTFTIVELVIGMCIVLTMRKQLLI